MGDVRAKARAARLAARRMLRATDAERREAVRAMAVRLRDALGVIQDANRTDLARAKEEGLAPSLLDRLALDEAKVETVADGCEQIAAMDDPVGKTLRSTVLDDRLHLYQVTCPLGVLACIFESRPDVVVQIASLAVRTGNAVLLKGGKEAAETNQVLADAVRAAITDAGLPADAVQLLEGREEVARLLELDDLVDLVIPRGSNALVRHIQDSTRIPVLGHADGICHVYVDGAADREKALRIVLDAKLDYPAACNAVETVLVHRDLAGWVPDLVRTLEGRGVTVHQGGAADFGREYGGPEMNIAIVESLDEALDHIATYGSHHTDSIVSDDHAAARAFVDGVDSAGVYINASTRFADGYRYGLGAEVGISTGRIHARGPVGLDGLVSTRWILVGDGHTVAATKEHPLRHEASRAALEEQLEAWQDA